MSQAKVMMNTKGERIQTSKLIYNIFKFSPRDMFMWFTVHNTREYQQSSAVSLGENRFRSCTQAKEKDRLS